MGLNKNQGIIELKTEYNKKEIIVNEYMFTCPFLGIEIDPKTNKCNAENKWCSNKF